MGLLKKHNNEALKTTVLTLASAVLLSVFFNPTASADVKIEPPPSNPATNPTAKASETTATQPSKPSIWHFQATYGVSSADVETPSWDSTTDPITARQKSTTGVFTENRFGHSFEVGLQPRQAIRMGLSLVNTQSVAGTGWMAALASKSKAPDWRTWGLGCDLFLLRQMSANLDLDAGLQADYFISGVTTLPTTDAATTELQNSSRLEQKSGWRVAFSGGIGGLYLGPIGFILRLSGHVLQAQFKGHTQALRAQGLQVQVGAGLALGRGEP